MDLSAVIWRKAYWTKDVRYGPLYSITLSIVGDYMIKKSGKKINVVVKDDCLKKNDIIDSFGDNTRIVKDTGWNCQTDLYVALDKLFQD